MVKVIYKLRLDGEFLSFQEHGDYTQILVRGGDSPVCFEKEGEAIASICDNFLFHHGCGSISDKDSAKERLAKIELVKVVITEEEEVIKPELYVPTNIEIHNWYVAAKGDTGLRIYLKSQCPGWDKLDGYSQKQFYDDDGYEFSSDYYRIKDYNEWIAAGKPVKPSISERVQKAREEFAKRSGTNNG